MLLFNALVKSIAQTQIEPHDESLDNDLMFAVGLLHSPETYDDLRGRMYYFEFPFSLATSLGLASTALMLPITRNEAGSGLVPPAVADNLLGGVLPNIIAASIAAPQNGLSQYSLYTAFAHSAAPQTGYQSAEGTWKAGEIIFGAFGLPFGLIMTLVTGAEESGV